MVTAIDLDQFAVALAPETWLVEGPSLLTREPKPVRDHPPAKGLATGHDRVLFKQDLGRQCWSKVGILRSNQLDRVLANPRNGTVVR